MVELIITEKPAQAEKIAIALADTKPKKRTKNSVTHYEIKHKGKSILVGCAVGHLFGLAKVNSKKVKYPTFDIEWKPKYEIDKNSEYTRKYVERLKELAKKADKFIVATDYDVEGSVIGYNIIRYICDKKDGKRMKFSTLTKDELIESYAKATKHLDFPQIHAGETRHHLDWFYGINISHALMTSIKNATGRFRIMSTGRVQGPTLKLIVKKEESIKKFKPKKYWELFLEGNLKKAKFLAKYKKGNFTNEKDVLKILNKIKGKKAIVDKLTKREITIQPPTPFDLTTLQIEAYKIFRITPKEVSQIAQTLYTKGIISYPRTSSQKLPSSIGYKKILKKLSRQKNIYKFCNELLGRKKLIPNEGKKEDPAHPAIYPTGEILKLSGKNLKLYNLVVNRFLAVFGTAAKKESTSVIIDLNKEKFSFSGSRIIDEGWYKYYKFIASKEVLLPELEKGESVTKLKINKLGKETQPPNRYSQASIIKEMESLSLGTKATRALILDALYQRNYIEGLQVKATPLGIKLIKTLEKYSHEIIDEELTKEFEKDMQKIRSGEKKPSRVINNAKKILIRILKKFKENEKNIGRAIVKATEKEGIFGTCPKCKKGSLGIRRGRFGLFIACDQYEQGCETTASLPKGALTKSTEKECEKCSFPIILVIRKGKRPLEICLNRDCPTKKPKEKPKNKKCPNCEDGKLVIRKGLYGSFYACGNFPKCRFIFSSKKDGGKKKKDDGGKKK